MSEERIAWFFSVERPCEEQVAYLTEEYNRLADRYESLLAGRDRLEKKYEAAVITCLACSEARERMHVAEDRAGASAVRADRMQAVVDALIELRAAQADRKRVAGMAVTAVMDERVDLERPGEDADLLDRANYGEALYAPYKERLTGATASLELALAALDAAEADA